MMRPSNELPAVHLCREVVDFRKGINGLAVLVEEVLQHDPFSEQLFDIPVEKVSDRYEIMRYGGAGELTQLTFGVVRFDHVAGQQLIALLPRVLQIDTWNDDEGSWLQSTLRFIGREARELRPGCRAQAFRHGSLIGWVNPPSAISPGCECSLRDFSFRSRRIHWQCLLSISGINRKRHFLGRLSGSLGWRRGVFVKQPL